MRRLIGIPIVMVLIGGLMALPVLATDAEDVVAELQLRGYYADPGVEIDIDEMERIAREATDLVFVALTEEPASGSDLFATEVLEQMGIEGTVFVVSPDEIGERSNVWEDEAVVAALDAAFEVSDQSLSTIFEAFSDELDAFVGSTAVDQPASGSGSGALIFLLIIVAVGVLIWWAIRRSKANREEMFQTRIDEVKTEIQGQLSEAANDILELEDDVLLSDNDEAKELYYAGSAGYAQFQESLAEAQTLAELHDLAEGIDVTLWKLESAEALLEGRSAPPKPDARPDLEPPAPTPTQQRHPELPEDLQMRRQRRDQRGTRPRQRSRGGIGGLGAAAAVLESVQQGRLPRVGSRRSAAPTRRASQVQMPDRGGRQGSRLCLAAPGRHRRARASSRKVALAANGSSCSPYPWRRRAGARHGGSP